MSLGASGASGFRLNLTLKLALLVVASFSAFVALFGYLSLREHRRHSEDLVVQSADRVSDLIQRSTRYQMLHNHREDLYPEYKAHRPSMPPDLAAPGHRGSVGVTFRAARSKRPGTARVVFVSRISPKKNLDYALRVVGGVQIRF